MTNTRFDLLATRLGTVAAPNFATADIRFLFLDASKHTTSLSANQFVDDLTVAAVVKRSDTLANKAFPAGGVAGRFNHDAETLLNVSGDSVDEVIYFHHTGTDSTALLLVRIHEFAAGAPFSPTGGQVEYQPAATGAWNM